MCVLLGKGAYFERIYMKQAFDAVSVDEVIYSRIRFVRIIVMIIHTYIPWIHKFVIATIGCGISHKDTKHTDKCSNNKQRQHRTKGRNHSQILFQNTVKITQQKV
jgi:hypothetical protein